MFTLLYQGSERQLADWNIRDDITLELVSKGPCVLTVNTTEAFDTATPQFLPGPPGQANAYPITLYQGRSGVGAGGSIWFKGYVAQFKRIVSGPKQGIEYTVKDLWWLFERETLRQPRNYIATQNQQGKPTSYGITFLSEIYLGQTVNLIGQTVALQTNGRQIAECLDWMNEIYNPTRKGNTYTNPGSVNPSLDLLTYDLSAMPPSTQTTTLGQPGVNIPYSRVQVITVAEALLNMLRWSPSTTVARDYTQPIPRLKFIDQNVAQNQFADISINITTQQESQIAATREDQRVLPGVVIHYKKSSSTNGALTWNYQTDIWPPNLGAQGAVNDFLPDVCTQFVELAGANQTVLSANLVTRPITDSTAIGWWQTYDRSLADTKITALGFAADNVFAILDDSGNPISTANFPYQLLNTGANCYSWMGVNVIEANVSCLVSYTQYAESGHQNRNRNVQSRLVTVRVKLTNGTGNYTATTHNDPGEPFPPMGAGGLANQIYNTFNQLTFSGRITLLASQLTSAQLTTLLPGARLKLIGPNNIYTNLFVQSVTARPHYGLLEVAFGPMAALGAKDVIELSRATRLRTVYDMPSGRDSGVPNYPTNVDLSSPGSQKENTSHGEAATAQHALLYQQTS